MAPEAIAYARHQDVERPAPVALASMRRRGSDGPPDRTVAHATWHAPTTHGGPIPARAAALDATFDVVAVVAIRVAFVAFEAYTSDWEVPIVATTTVTLEDQVRHMSPVAAPPEQQAQVVALSRALEGMVVEPLRRAPDCRLVGPDGTSIVLPPSVFFVLERVAEVMARGDSITIVPVGREVTTQQAADLLNVSRQYLVRLLDEGRIPFRKTGTHRRVRIEDVLAFREARDKDRRAGLRELSRMTEEFGGYDAEQP